MYYRDYYTPTEMAQEVSGIIGKPVRVEENELGTYAIRPDDIEHTSYVVSVPKGTREIDNIVSAMLYHEAMHGKYSDYLGSKKLEDLMDKHGLSDTAKEVMFSIANVSEDVRVELKGSEEYWGAGSAFSKCNRLVVPKIMEKMKGKFSNGDWLVNDRGMAARTFLVYVYMLVGGYVTPFSLRKGMGWTGLSRSLHDIDDVYRGLSLQAPNNRAGFIGELGSYENEFALKYSPKGDATMHYAYDLADDLAKSKTTAEALELFSDAFTNKVIRFLPPEDRAGCSKFMQELVSESKANGLRPDEDEQTCRGSNGQGAAQQCAEGHGKPTDQTDFAKVELITEEEAIESGRFEYSSKLYGGGYSTTTNTRFDAKSRLPIIEGAALSIYENLRTVLDEIRLWQDTVTDTPGHRRGRLDTSALHRVAVGHDNVFSQRETPDFNDDVAFSVTIDVSGSMCSNPSTLDSLNTSVGIGAGIGYAMSQIDKPCSITTFDTSARTVVDNENTMGIQEILDILAEVGGGTRFNVGLAESMKHLTKCTQRSKVLIAITDGDFDKSEISKFAKPMKQNHVHPFFIVIGDAHAERMRGEILSAFVNTDITPDICIVREGEVGTVVDHIKDFTYKLLTTPIDLC